MGAKLRLENSQKLIEKYNLWMKSFFTTRDGNALKAAVKQKLSTLLLANGDSSDWDLLFISRCPRLLVPSMEQEQQDVVMRDEQDDVGNVLGDQAFLPPNGDFL